MPPLTPEQLEARTHFLGGTDMAALAGVSSFARPIDVFYDKRPDLAPPGWGDRKTTGLMGLGHLLEPVVADLFTEATGIKLRRTPGPIRCPYHEWEGGMLDRRAACGGVFEAKWSTGKAGWGEGLAAGADPHEVPPLAEGELPPVPPGYYIQVQWYLHVARRRHAHLGALLGYATYRHYTLVQDERLERTLVDLAATFWAENVIPGVPPPADGSEAWSAAVRARYPSDDGTTLPATPEQWLALRQLRAVRAEQDKLATERARIEQAIQAAMGPATALEGAGVKVSWKQSKAGQAVVWPEAWAEAAGLLPEHVASAIVERHTRTVPGARPFRVTWDEEDEA